MLQDNYTSLAAPLRFVWQFSNLIFVLQHGGGTQKGLWGWSDNQSVKSGLATAAMLLLHLYILYWWGFVQRCPRSVLSSWIRDVAGCVWGFFHFAAPSHHTLHVPTDGSSLGDVLIILGSRIGTHRSSRHAFPCVCEWWLQCTWEISSELDIVRVCCIQLLWPVSLSCLLFVCVSKGKAGFIVASCGFQRLPVQGRFCLCTQRHTGHPFNWSCYIGSKWLMTIKTGSLQENPSVKTLPNILIFVLQSDF